MLDLSERKLADDDQTWHVPGHEASLAEYAHVTAKTYTVWALTNGHSQKYN